MIQNGRTRPMRTCDRCGALRPGETFRVISGRWICNWHDHYIAPETLDRLPIKTFPVKPFKDAKPLEPRNTYERAEWEIFNFCTENYRTDYFDCTREGDVPVTAASTYGTGVSGAAWTCVYLHALITENKRPLRMIAVARTKLAEIATWLLTRQFANPAKLTVANTDTRWGGFEQTGSVNPAVSGTYQLWHTASAGLALLRAYQVLGGLQYLDGARAAIWFCRTMQCGGKQAALFSSTDAAGTLRSQWGAGAQKMLVNSSSVPFMDHYLTGLELSIVEFYQAFLTAIGDETIGSSFTSGSTFSLSRASLVSAAITEAMTFWTAGAFGVEQGTTVCGLSPVTPFDAFNSYPTTKGINPNGTGSWRYLNATTAAAGTTIYFLSWSMGIRALRAVEGDTARVTGLFDYLMTFGSNSTFELPAAYSDKTLYVGVKGTYDPKTALDLFPQVKGTGAPRNSFGVYSFATTGLLAAMYSARQQASFKAMKDSLNEPRPKTVQGERDGVRYYVGAMGRAGMSFQPYGDSNTLSRFKLVSEAAMTGLVYRQAPTAFMGRGQ